MQKLGGYKHILLEMFCSVHLIISNWSTLLYLTVIVVMFYRGCERSKCIGGFGETGSWSDSE